MMIKLNWIEGQQTGMLKCVNEARMERERNNVSTRIGENRNLQYFF
jgi:hypothetical protein